MPFDLRVKPDGSITQTFVDSLPVQNNPVSLVISPKKRVFKIARLPEVPVAPAPAPAPAPTKTRVFKVARAAEEPTPAIDSDLVSTRAILTQLWEGEPGPNNSIEFLSSATLNDVIKALNEVLFVYNPSAVPYVADEFTYTSSPTNPGVKTITPKFRSYQAELGFKTKYNRKGFIAYNDEDGDKYGGNVDEYKPNTNPARPITLAAAAPIYNAIAERQTPKAELEEARAIQSKSEIIPEVIKKLRVGDTIVYGQESGYMGDGGDSRDVGYTIRGKVLRLLGNYTYEVEGRYSDSEPMIFKLDSTGEWLKDKRNYQNVYQINNVNRPTKRSDASLAREKAVEDKKRADKAAKVKEDFTKATKLELRRKIEKFFSEKGRRLTNLGTASKEKLLEVIKKYEIPM